MGRAIVPPHAPRKVARGPGRRPVRDGLRIPRLGRRVVAPPGPRAPLESRVVRRPALRRRRPWGHLLPDLVPAPRPPRRDRGEPRLRAALRPRWSLHLFAAASPAGVLVG